MQDYLDTSHKRNLLLIFEKKPKTKLGHQQIVAKICQIHCLQMLQEFNVEKEMRETKRDGASSSLHISYTINRHKTCRSLKLDAGNMS